MSLLGSDFTACPPAVHATRAAIARAVCDVRPSHVEIEVSVASETGWRIIYRGTASAFLSRWITLRLSHPDGPYRLLVARKPPYL